MDSQDEWITSRKRPARKQLNRQVSPIGISFEPKPSLATKDAKTLSESASEFKLFYALVKAGAKWGDIDLYDLDEWTELVEQRQRSPVYTDLDNMMDSLVESGVIKRAVVYEPEYEEEPEPEPEPRVVLPLRPPCEVCGIYLSHSDPPKDFKGRNLCCLWCSIRKGHEHGDRCERCEIYTTYKSPIEEY